MTRRAPPLGNISRHSTTEPSVHRPLGRWTGWLASAAVCALSACHVLPEMQFARTLPLSRSRTPLDIEGPNGTLNRAERVRLTRKLSDTGDTALLDYHLAAMNDLGAPPLLTGNQAGRRVGVHPFNFRRCSRLRLRCRFFGGVRCDQWFVEDGAGDAVADT